MSEWEPATEAEAAMREALAASDQEQYFGILARSDLLLPVSADALAGRAPMGWGTWTTGNRTHILAFTSPIALRLCLNEPGGSYRPVPFHTLAFEWPNYEWWLAVNPGLPIESYLPSWFVSQLTRGDVRLPGRTMGARARMAQSDLAAALHGRVRASAPAPGGATRAEAYPAGPQHGGVDLGVETVDAEVIDYPPAAPATEARVYPTNPSYPAAASDPPTAGEPHRAGPETVLKPGLGAMLAGVGVFGPTDERPMTFTDSIYAEPRFAEPRFAEPAYPEPVYSEPVYVEPVHVEPVHAEQAYVGSAYAEPVEQRRSGFGGTRETVAGSFGGESFSFGGFGTNGADLGEPAVAEPVVAPARSSKRDVQDAEVVSTGDWADTFAPANETEANLLVAAEENNTDAFLSTLLLAQVILPVPAGTPATARPRERDFPWQFDEMDGQPFISVFTSPERLSEHRPVVFGADASAVSVRFVQLIGAWPSEDVSFAINPGSPVGATLPGSQIVALAAWAKEVGLRDEPAAEVMVAAAARKSESGPATSVAGAPANGADRATIMQRTVPPGQVSFYLERGYDRVSGFVNRASEVAHLNSPKLLYRALGLNYSGSPFADDDAEVHVVRWVAHRSDLYRLPYGGQHEAGMRAMQGWVIERPPFRGNGFAPGDTDVVSEFKVDSIRLPHGAQMWRLAKDGTETLVATFDADTTKWVAPPFGYEAGSYA